VEYVGSGVVNKLVPFRTCTRCGETKPTTRENFGTKPSGKPKARCRACYRAHTNAYAAENPARGRQRARDRKAAFESIGNVNEHLQFRALLFSKQKGACYFCSTTLDWVAPNRMLE
jgi:hypothetical protein